MNANELTDTDTEQFRTASWESDDHLWAKIELYQRKKQDLDPSFEGEYHFERPLADRVPDCHINGESENRWIEIVTRSDQDYRIKTRHALRLGYPIHWVFHVDQRTRMYDAQEALTPELEANVEFGVFNPDTGLLDLGDPVTLDNYRFTVESMIEFNVHWINGYRGWSCRRVDLEDVKYSGFDLGEFEIFGYPCRLLAVTRDGRYCRAITPDSELDALLTGKDDIDYLDEAQKWFPKKVLEDLVDGRAIRRKGPVKGSRRYD